MNMYNCQRVRDLREDADLSQGQIAEMLGISQQVYSTYETAQFRFPIDHLIKLALYYKTSIDYLVGLTDDRKPYPRKRN